jgi:hypothetical protein
MGCRVWNAQTRTCRRNAHWRIVGPVREAFENLIDSFDFVGSDNCCSPHIKDRGGDSFRRQGDKR